MINETKYILINYINVFFWKDKSNDFCFLGKREHEGAEGDFMGREENLWCAEERYGGWSKDSINWKIEEQVGQI